MKRLITLILIINFFSCEKYYESEVKQESGIVIAKQFQGEINETEPTVGFSTSGDMTFGSVSIHVKQKFDVVFKCDHGKIFTVNDPNIYAKVNEGQRVVIDYTEKLNEKNEVKDFVFKDANPVK
ncbi:hypothetical protein [Tenacibaculum singaporense]|uniref:hypothetical protein n=1 Tax=Tenacibaculum singaporense TaxID=2358479 RepID=UPI000F6847EE|nr:hypothetical protein [Tenacibaculum singaporense]RSC96035.1 hypothetical protein EI424_02640 [Tenacibaculum singaporense]